MHRVLRGGGFALIVGLDENAAPGPIADAVLNARLGSIDGWITRMTVQHLLLECAYRPEDMMAMPGSVASTTASCTWRASALRLCKPL